MRKVVAISDFAEERDRKTFIALVRKAEGANRGVAQWLLANEHYTAATAARWMKEDGVEGFGERKLQMLRRWAASGFSGLPFDKGNQPKAPAEEVLKTKDDFQDDGPAADQDDPDAPGVDAHTLKNILDSISQAKAVAEAWRKIVKASSFDSGEKAQVHNAIKKLVAKWRTVQSTLERKGKGQCAKP